MTQPIIEFIPVSCDNYAMSENYTPDHQAHMSLIKLVIDDQCDDNDIEFWFDSNSSVINQSECLDYLVTILSKFELLFDGEECDRDTELSDPHMIRFAKYYRPDLFEIKESSPSVLELLQEFEHIRYCAFKMSELYHSIQNTSIIVNNEDMRRDKISLLDYLKTVIANQ